MIEPGEANILASDLLLWQPQHTRGLPVNTYIDQLWSDNELLTIEDINKAINDREGWKKYVIDYRASLTW